MKLAFAILRAQSQPPWLQPPVTNTERFFGISRSQKSVIPIQDVRASSPLMLEFVSWYSNNDSQTLARKLYGDELGEHATPDEVSITKYLYPELAEKTGYLDPEFVTNVPPGRTARQMEGESSSTRNCHNLTQT